MVYINNQVIEDLEKIIDGLISWEKIELTKSFIDTYIDDLVEQCYNIEKKTYHFNCKYSSHKKHGKKVFQYRRNKRTSWYIIYDMDQFGNFFVNKILSYYKTLDE